MTPRQFGICMLLFSASMLALGVSRQAETAVGQVESPITLAPGVVTANVAAVDHAPQLASSPIRVILPSPYEAR